MGWVMSPFASSETVRSVCWNVSVAMIAVVVVW